MTEIPAEIMEEARRVAAGINATIDPIEHVEAAIGGAILAERERCVKIVDGFIEDYREHGRKHPNNQEERQRAFALGLSAFYIASAIRSQP